MNDSKSSNGEEHTGPIKKVACFLRRIREVEKADKQGKHLYRGVGNSAFDLESTAEVRLRNAEKDFAESEFYFADDIVENEKLYNHGLIEHFKLEEFNENKSEILKMDLGILAQLRHYQAANSFIDFTGNPLIALWFACKGASDPTGRAPESNGAVFVINTSNNRFVEISSEEQLRDYSIENVFSEFESKWIFWKPTDLNKRMPAQDSYLLIGKNKFPVKESGGFITKIEVDKGSKEDILKELSSDYNINASKLFPDMHGFADVNSKDSPYGGPEEIYERGIRIRDAKIEKIKREELKYESENKRQDIRGKGRKSQKNKREIKQERENKRQEFNEKKAEHYYHRGIAKCHLGYFKDAIDDFNAVIGYGEENTKVYFNRGVAKCRRAEDAKDKSLSDEDRVRLYGEAAMDFDTARKFSIEEMVIHINDSEENNGKDDEPGNK